jgi:hypothetical protein
MKPAHAFAVVVLLLSLVDRPATAQEMLTYRPPARDFAVQLNGEQVLYQPDGGCSSAPTSRVPVAAEPMSAAQCAQSKARTRAATAAAIDGGALER